jgi:hypothetical protein
MTQIEKYQTAVNTFRVKYEGFCQLHRATTMAINRRPPVFPREFEVTYHNSSGFGTKARPAPKLRREKLDKLTLSSDAGVPGIAVFRCGGAEAFAEAFQAVGDCEPVDEFDAFVA